MGIVQRQSNIYEFYHVQAINKNCTKENTKLGIIAKRSKNCTKEKQKLYQGEAAEMTTGRSLEHLPFPSFTYKHSPLLMRPRYEWTWTAIDTPSYHYINFHSYPRSVTVHLKTAKDLDSKLSFLDTQVSLELVRFPN